MPRLVPDAAWPHIDPGRKRHKIGIQSQNEQDSFGQVAGAWNPVLDDCYAAIETTTAREQFQDGFVSQVVHRVSIDWTWVKIRTGMRVVVHPIFGGNASVYEIQAIENVQQRNLVMVLTCLEIDNAKVGS